MNREIAINGAPPVLVRLTRGPHRSQAWLDGHRIEAILNPIGHHWEADVDGLSARVSFAVDKDMVLVHAFGRTWRLSVIDPAERALQAADASDFARAPMPGVPISVMVQPGDAVTAGQPMVIIESMKMQTEICASRDGTVHEVHARLGEPFPLGAMLVILVPVSKEA